MIFAKLKFISRILWWFESSSRYLDSLIDSCVIIAETVFRKTEKEKGSIGVDFQRELESVLNDALFPSTVESE